MTNNILIFRTDKIGDLLATCPAMLTIKKKINNSKTDILWVGLPTPKQEKWVHKIKSQIQVKAIYMFVLDGK